ncbi:MAG: UvrD-helicase domain-containing protein [Holosporales bacterium]|jgi:ATP-dependent helicase/nuclease subunit A|nr:UvrD-helicase domain-containing protein [Holosporales bacterium]
MAATELKKICDVRANVWIEASAGTGKTKALTDRILALLVSGVSAKKILCITFTKAAAAEMLSRIRKKLGQWKICDENILFNELTELLPQPNQLTIEKSRRLFDEVLDAGSSFKVQTIHSFCQRLLESFPTEAKVSEQIRIFDEYEAMELLKIGLQSSIASADIKSHLIKAYDILSLFKSDESLVILIRSIIKDCAQIELLRKKTDEEILAEYGKLCGLKPKHITLDPNSLRKENEITSRSFAIANAAFALAVKDVYVRYAQLKRDRLDYDDLIFKALMLLRNPDNNWVMYKLDGEISHILIDEAQDTNPLQWEVLKALSANFFSDNIKTLFVVGDHKQSIYGFQGANHPSFINAYKYFKDKTIEANLNWHDVRLNLSYRSTPEVLNFVDKVFCDSQKTPGIGDYPTKHTSFREQDKGQVEFWPLIDATAEQLPPMTIPTEAHAVTNQESLLAKEIANKIAKIINQKLLVPSKRRAAIAGDFLILLQQRGTLMAQIIKELQDKRLPVKGIDQLTLTDEIVIEDLISLGKFVLNPYDDFNLACLLKSPLMAIDENALMNLCINRKESLYQHIKELAANSTSPEICDMFRLLNKWLQIGGSLSLYSFFEETLDHPDYGARKNIIARLGGGAIDAISEFMELLLKYEISNISTLSSFIPWFLKKCPKLKREFGIENKIRVMTVHGAKGLQAPFVVLANINSQSRNELVPTWLSADDSYACMLPIFFPRDIEIPSKIAGNIDELKQEQEYERQRLLYVALTRAQDHIYITGINTKRKSAWYNLLVNCK